MNYYLSYIKINKIDVQGANVSTYLKEVLDIKLNYTDISPITFEISTIIEYSTYYLVLIKFQGYGALNTLASSSNNHIRDYSLSAVGQNAYGPGSGEILLPLGSKTYGPIDLQNVITDAQSYFNNITGEYTFGNVPNTLLKITASLDVSCPVNSSYRSSIYNFTKGIDLITSSATSITAGTTASITFKGTILSQQYGDVIGLKLYHNGNYNTQQLAIQGSTILMTGISLQNTGVSGSGDTLIITTPGLSSDNPLYGNYTEFPINSKYTLLPPDPYIPVIEFNSILSGSFTKSTVSQYGYELKRSVYPRYLGSRYTTDGFNTNSISQSILVQSSTKMYLNPMMNDLVPANDWNTTIFEFNGGKPCIELPLTSRIDISQIINTDNTSSVSTLSPLDQSFNFIIQNKLALNSIPNISQYITDYIIPSDTKIISNNVSPTPVFIGTSYPQDWSYVTSSTSNGSGPNYFLKNDGSFYRIKKYVPGDNFTASFTVFEGTINTNNCIMQATNGNNANIDFFTTWTKGTVIEKIPYYNTQFLIDNSTFNLYSGWYAFKDDKNQYYPKGFITGSDISRSIAEGKNNGERWFVSLYSNNFISPVNVNEISKYPNNFTSSLDITQYPFQFNAAYEIDNIIPANVYHKLDSPNVSTYVTEPMYTFTFKNIPSGKSIVEPPFSTGFPPAPPGSYYSGGTGNNGFVIWKTTPNSNTLLFNNIYLQNLGPGNLISDNTHPIIKENLNYITKTFGNRT